MAAQPSDVRWASRWDTYLLMMDDQIHWFSIINSLMIVLFLSGMVAMIMMRTLHRDISNYNQLETAEEVQDETGWKLVRASAVDWPASSTGLSGRLSDGQKCLGFFIHLLQPHLRPQVLLHSCWQLNLDGHKIYGHMLTVH